jgi:heme/copper-type cytochrome/quinol oxidase subunit 4
MFSGYTHTEGFWCAVIGASASGIICILLSLHAILHYNDAEKEGKEFRIQGQQFMLSMIVVFSIVVLEALIMSRIVGNLLCPST